MTSTRIPAGRSPLKHEAGLLTYSLYRAFPAMRQWLSAITIFGTYSSRYCFGFSPNFLFTPRGALAIWETFCITKIELKRLICKFFFHFFWVKKNGMIISYRQFSYFDEERCALWRGCFCLKQYFFCEIFANKKFYM